MTTPKLTTLIAGHPGSSHFGSTPFLAEAVRLTCKDEPLALYVGAASGDEPTFGAALTELIRQAGAARVLWPKLARKQHGALRNALGSVDFVLLGGGDVYLGMQTLRDAGLIGDLHSAARRGAVFAGLSAGSIMLGERWIRWSRPDASDDEAETYACLGIVPCTVDTHGEADGWREAQSYAAVRARETGQTARAYAIPSGCALLAGPGPALHARGAPVPVFAAQPRQKARLEKTLAVGS